MMQYPRILSVCLVSVLAFNATSVRADHVNWSSDVETALRTANESGRLVLMKFTADWCGYCKKMERETFTRPAVARTVNEHFVPVLIDADKHKDLVKHLKIKGLPSLLVVSPQMVILSRVSGYQTESKLLPKLQTILAQHSHHKPDTAVAGNTAPAPAQTRPATGTAQTPPVSTASSSTPAIPTTAPVAPAVNAPAFGGLCLPAVKETRSLVSGRPEFTATYHGRTLYFSSAEHRERFQTSPAKYWPANDGRCPVTQIDGGKTVEGKLEFAAMFRGGLWVTDSAEAMQKFVAAPATYVDALPGQ